MEIFIVLKVASFSCSLLLTPSITDFKSTFNEIDNDNNAVLVLSSLN